MPVHQTISPVEATAKSLDALLTSIEHAPSATAAVAFKAAIRRHSVNLHATAGPEGLAAALARVRSGKAALVSYADIDRRLRRIEAGRGGTAPTRIMADRPMTAAEMTDALADWPAWIADGRASVRNGIFWITGPEMTQDEWEALHATESETLH